MSHHFLIHPFVCLRLLACCLVLPLSAAVWSPPFAAAQDVMTDEIEDEDVTAEEAPDEEAPAEDAATDQAPAEEEASEQPAAADEAAEQAAPASWDVSKPCENYQHPYEADLCQQWRTAQAAERNLGLTRLLMLIGAVATLLLLLMFVPLLMAVMAARRAARGGASVATNDTSREDELRAYVDVDKLEFIETAESEGTVKVKVTFRNTGQTPAFKIKSVAQVGIRDVSDEDLLPVMPLPDRSLLDAPRPRLGRDATATEIVQCDSTPSLADRVMKGDATILVWGFAEYMDVFDRKRKTAFQYLCNADTLETGLIFKPMVRGDEDA